MSNLRPDLLLDALKRHAAEHGHSEAAANDAFARINDVAKGRTHRPFAISDVMRKESANG